MLAYYVEWHMRRLLAPLLFDESHSGIPSLNQEPEAQININSPDNNTIVKQKSPVHSFQTLLADLGTICKNRVESCLEVANICFDKITQPTQLQQTALDVLSVRL